MRPRPHLSELLPDELARLLRADGVAVGDDEARRAVAHALSPTGARDEARRPLSRRLREAIDARVATDRLEVVERADDPADGFRKYLLRSPDGALHEAVRIPLDSRAASPRGGGPGAKPLETTAGRFSVCLSSQVGCAMACVFCATGRLGLTRNLEAWEMVEAFRTVRDEAPGRVSGAVFMGQGEPFHNYERVIRAARVLSHPCGGRIRQEAITISTVGLVPQIRRFARERQPYKLIVSLSSAIPEKRRALLPVAGDRWSLEEVASALREQAASSRDRITIAWVTMSGVNTGADEVAALQRLLGDLRLRINLIEVNDATGAYIRPSDPERSAFIDALQLLRAPIVRRYSGGRTRHAACGMLANARTGDGPS